MVFTEGSFILNRGALLPFVGEDCLALKDDLSSLLFSEIEFISIGGGRMRFCSFVFVVELRAKSKRDMVTDDESIEKDVYVDKSDYIRTRLGFRMILKEKSFCCLVIAWKNDLYTAWMKQVEKSCDANE